MLILRFFALCISIALPLHAQLSSYELQQLSRIPFYDKVASETDAIFENVFPSDYPETLVLSKVSNPLFRQYPALQTNLSYICLGDFPTPIHYCHNLSAQYDPSTTLLIKHDGITGIQNTDGTREFGGNKLRKLQYLLADALAHGHNSVVTFGCVGSNHVVQTAVCTQQVGLWCYSMLISQPNAHIVRRNLLLQQAYNAIITFSDTLVQRARNTLEVCAIHKQHTGLLPYIIPTGGSIARGALGYVEAAFELKEQIEAGTLPYPDHIYVTLGSGGTAAGLLLGCQAAGINATFHCILDEPANKQRVWEKVERLFTQTNDLLISLDATFPRCTLTEKDCHIVDTYSGTNYGLFTEQGVEAITIVQACEGITLDGVYTSKCMSALLADLEQGKLHNSVVLFWNTFCAEDMTHITDYVDYQELPEALHAYFQNDVQALDS